jgi:hypothetical protein
MASHCFDTSAFIECWSGRYRRTTFTGLWSAIDSEVSAGGVCSPEEVLREVEKKEDGLHAFMKGYEEQLIVPLDEEVMAGTREILAEFPD